MDMQAALEFSNAAAALNCTAIGARGHIPFRDEVDALLSAAASGAVQRREATHIAERCSLQASPASAAAR
jgi:sulfofructose kinase